MGELIFAGLVLSGAWTQLDEIGWIGWAALAVVAAFDFLGPRLRWPRPSWPVVAGDRAAAIAASALCALVLAHLALTFREEFGFSGDEGYHLSATRAFAIYFMRAGPFLAVVVAVFAALRLKGVRFAATVATAGLVAASYALPQSALFGRYPTAFYLIATPLNVIFDVVHSPYPYTANHIINTLSMPAWLFLFRPLIIGRWPDWRVLCVALIIYFQSPALIYLGSPLLEPWAIVFALLSIEAIVELDPDRRWIAVPLCLAAICFKETMILLLPTVWLLSSIEWQDGRPALRPGRVALGVAAVTPFVIYYAVRSSLTTARGYDAADAAALFTQARVVEWLSNVNAQVGAGGLAVVVAAIALTVVTAPLWIATALGVTLFFFADAISVPWNGYSRFLALSSIAVCGAVFATLYRRQVARRNLMAICGAIVLLQLPLTLRTFALDFSPDHERNSLQWRGVLIRMPIRALATKIPATPGGDHVTRLRVTARATDLISLPVAYPDLAARYQLESSANDCSCRSNEEAVIAVFEWPANLAASGPALESFASGHAACVKQVASTCATTVSESDRSGATVGLLGVGRR